MNKPLKPIDPMERSSWYKKPVAQHFVAILVLILMVFAFTPDVLLDKRQFHGDTLHGFGMRRDVVAYHHRTGELAHWTDRSYCGMPSTMIYPVYPSNLASVFTSWLSRSLNPQFLLLFLPMLCLYIALTIAGYPIGLSVLGAIAFGLSTVNIGNVDAGHSSKVNAIATALPILIGVHLTFERKWLAGFGLVALFTALHISMNHFQITYYTAILAGLISLFGTIRFCRKMEFSVLSRSLLTLVIAVIIGILPNTSTLWSNYDYMQDTVRGTKIVHMDSDPKAEIGLDRDYANVFSHNLLEVGSLLIPRIVGGSNNEQLGPDSDSYEFIKRTGLQGSRIKGEKVEVPLFWGDKPLNGAPTYFGAVMMLLLVAAFVFSKGHVKLLLGGLILLTVIVSMGSHLDIINKLMFDHLPFYNRFRAPSMILGITAGLIAWFAVDGMNNLIRDREIMSFGLKKLFIGFMALSALCLFFASIGPQLFDFSWDYGQAFYGVGIDDNFRDQVIRAGNPEVLVNELMEAIRSDRASEMRNDAFRSLFLLILGAGIFYAYYKNKFGGGVLIGALMILVTIDLFSVGKRYMSRDEFVKNPTFSSVYPPAPSDFTIDNISTSVDRMVDIGASTWIDARPAYYHPTIGGNHAAKLRRYQDLIDYRLNKELQFIRSGNGNPNVPALNMLNLRFVKTGPGPSDYLENITSLGFAWFVDSIAWVGTSEDELTSIDSLRRTEFAILHDEFKPFMNGFEATSSTFSKIELSFKEPGKVIYRSSTDVERLLVMSEIWHRGNEYWVSTIDGELVDHIRANYLLRAIRVPAGVHEIEFKYRNLAFEKSEPIAAGGSALLVLSLILTLVVAIYRKPKDDQGLDTSM